MADVGFLRRLGGRPPRVRAKNPFIWRDFCLKLHGNERNLIERGRASLAPLGSSNRVGSQPIIWPNFTFN